MKSVIRLVLLVSLCGYSLPAQTITASIAGTVVDATGAVVPGAKVTITDTERNHVARAISSDAAGGYSAPLLPIGTYSVAVEAKGFKTTTRVGVVLNVNDKATVNLSLQIGDVTGQVTVEEAPVSVELQTAAQSNLISGTQIRELQLSTRNYAQLVGIAPGVSSTNTDQLFTGHYAPAGSSTSISFAMNGNRATANNWQVDGADNVDRGANGNILTYPSLDALSEFKVLRSSYSADFGRSAGGQINAVTKSGTSEFHGDAYEFVRNDAFAANNFLNNANRVNVGPDGKSRVPPLRWNDFGYTIGGPVYIPRHYNTGKNKTFFFFSQEFRRVITYSTPTATIATADEKKGIFPRPVCLAVSGGACTQTGTQITNINPVAAAYIKDIFSQAPDGAPGTNLNNPLFRNVFNNRQELYKIDHVFGAKLSVFGRYLTDKIPTLEPGGVNTGGTIPGVSTTSTNSPGYSWVFRAIATLSPTWLNEAGFNYSYGAVISKPVGTDSSALSPDIKINLPFPVTLGRVSSLSFGGGGSGIAGFGPYGNYNRNYNFYDNMTKIVGRHNMRFGFTQNFYQKTENAAGNNVGSFSFTGAVRPANTSIFEQSWADFLLGRAASFSQDSLDLYPDIRVRQTEIYFQDDMRLGKNLTLNLGVRYSVFREPVDAHGMLTNFDPSAYNPSKAPQINPTTGNLVPNTGDPLNGVIVNNSNSRYGSKAANENWRDVAPRIGFAWDPTGRGKMSIRSGYGIYYDSILYGIFEQNIFANPPYVNSVSIPNTLLDNPTAGAPTISLAPKVLHGTPIPYRTPYVQQWSFDIQHQATKDLLVDIGYFGSKGTHLTGIIDLNQPAVGAAIAAGLAPPGAVFTSTNLPLLNAVRPYLGYNAINSIETWFDSNYHSLQASVEKRFGGSSLVKLSYTFSKNFSDNASDRNNAPQNSHNFHDSEYGVAAYDRRHILIVNYVYELPFLKSRQGLAGHVLGGWQVSGITQFMSGLPSTPGSSLGTDPAGLGIVGSSSGKPRPDWACNPNAGAPHTQFAWFNTGCFVPVAAGQVRPGNAGTFTIGGPGLNRWDFSLFKNVKFRERASLQIRSEFYNVFNHTNPNTFGTSLGSSTYGQVTAYRDPRILQLGAKFYF